MTAPRTCPNCRYELRPGSTACPMCGRELDGVVGKRRSPGALLLVTLVVAAALVGGATFAARGGGGGGSASTCPRRAALDDEERPAAYTEPPATLLSGPRTLVFETDEGTIEIALDVARSPKTASSVAFLACDGFYDGLPFHRVVPDFVIQGGDPLGNDPDPRKHGTGGPGYTIVEAPPEDLVYEPGVVAMAKKQNEEPGTSGSQFFIVSGQQARQLPAEYALVGEVEKGMDVVAKIERSAGTEPVTIRVARVV